MQISDALIVEGEFAIRELDLTWPKTLWLWNKFQEHKTLFSDLTREDFGNFMNSLVSKSTYWFEVYKHGKLVGLVWLSDTYQVVDATVHCVMFDRRPAEKAVIIKPLIKWVFDRFAFNRLTAAMPAIYFGTINMVRKLGFTHEGTKREGVLIGGKWNDIVIYGLTRKEVASWD